MNSGQAISGILSIRNLSAAFLATWIFLSPARVGAAAEETFTIEDAGQPRTFAVALDEWSVSTPTARRVIMSIAPAASRVELMALAAARSTDPLQMVEPVLYEMRRGRRTGTPRILTREVLVRAGNAEDVARAAEQTGAAVVKPSGVEEFWLLESADAGGALDLAVALRKQPGVAQANPLLARQQVRKWGPNDPNFSRQWHLLNTGQSNGVAGTDVRITNAWDAYRGAGLYIGIIDDGLQVAHPDLVANCETNIDRDINYGDNDPTPDLADDNHGTACAGVAAAKGNNGLGVCGAAPDAKLVGLRLISAAASDAEEALAINWSNQTIHVKNNSWGPSDDGNTVEGPGTLTMAALSNACASGRAGKGTIIVWAGGNGLDAGDDSNFDGYANSIYTIAIGAVGNTSTQSWYSESGANLVVCAPSSGDNLLGIDFGIWTTDRTGASGYNSGSTAGEPTDSNYTSTFGGTSSAAPLASGVVALILQANPTLGWRDVQEILMRSATKNNAADADWRTNAAGFKINHKYGGGMINASGAVARASTWTNLAPQSIVVSNKTSLSVAIPDFGVGALTQSFAMAGTTMRVEHVQVVLSATHPWRGDLGLTLVSPGGTTSVISRLQRNDNTANYVAWPFMSVRNWGEPLSGTWRVRIEDLGAGDTGTLTALKLVFYGTTNSPLSLPGKATAPAPAHLATGVATPATPSWTAGSGASGYRVNFGTANPPPFALGQAGTTFTTNLALGTTYYWRVDSTNATGTTTGDVWQFTTAVAALALNPASTNLASGTTVGRAIAVTANVSWTAATNVAWVAVTAGNSGSDNGTVTYAVAANGTSGARTGAVIVAGGGLSRTCTVVQAGAIGQPTVQSDASFGVVANQFGFNLNWTSGQVVVVDACTNLAAPHPVWTPMQTNFLAGTPIYYGDPRWTNHVGRFYRIRAQ